MPDIGRNSGAVAGEQLKSLVERIERLNEEKQSIADDIKDVYAEAKAMGFDTKVMREIVRLRKQDPNERAEREAIRELYMQALGGLADLPLGQAAIAAAESQPTSSVRPGKALLAG